MKWHHILDKHPEIDEIIIRIDNPFKSGEGDNWYWHRNLYMGKYFRTKENWEEYLVWCKESGVKLDFYWMYAKDFSYPEPPKDNE